MAEPENRRGGDRADARAGEEAFRRQLVTFLVFALFFFVLNLLTSRGVWWFYWPILGWGLAITLRAVSLYGAEAPARVVGLVRSTGPGGAPPPSPVGTRQRVESADNGATGERPGSWSTAAVVDEAEVRVARLWRLARQIPTETAREQAFRVCAAADRVAEVLAQDQDRVEPETARWFVDRLLSPTEALLERYGRLAKRDVDAAAPTLAKVEREDLPMIETRLDALYQQLHRGDVVDLAVASEMLALELDDAPPTRRRSG